MQEPCTCGMFRICRLCHYVITDGDAVDADGDAVDADSYDVDDKTRPRFFRCDSDAVEGVYQKGTAM